MNKKSLRIRHADIIFKPDIDVQSLEILIYAIGQFASPTALNNQTWLTPASLTENEIQPNPRNCTFYRLEELRHDSNFPQREAMENVFSAMAGLECRLVYLLSGDEEGVRIHFGVVHDPGTQDDLSAYDKGTILHDAFAANFQGSRLHKLVGRKEIGTEIFDSLHNAKRCGLIMGIPSFNEQRETQEAGFQGIERLINGMLGQRWQLLIVGEPVAAQELDTMKRSVFDTYNNLHRAAKESIQQSQNIAKSVTTTTGTSESVSISKGSSTSSGDSHSSSGSNQGSSKTKGQNTGESDGMSSGYALSSTQENIRKELQDLLDYMDKELLERIKLGQSKGMFKIAAYALAENQGDFVRLSQLIKSVFQGDSSRFSPLRVHPVPQELKDTPGEMDRLLCGLRPWQIALEQTAQAPILFGHPVESGRMGLSTMLTSKELSLIAGLPTREVPGIPMVEGVDFGVNPTLSTTDKQISIGTVLHRGSLLKGNSITLDLDELCRHVFVAGVTGSGKTTTCQKLLLESNLPFMVIEPAKTEYRSLANTVPGLQIFTLGNERLAPLRLNPFELFRFETVTGHVDLLKAAFAAAFPMEAAMPYMLEEAMYRIYEKRGWDVSGMQTAERSNRMCADPWDPQCRGRYWPTMDDLLVALGEVVDKEGFDTRLANDYRASLVSRLRNLTVGSKGSMLNCRVSTNFEALMDAKVVLEMDDLKDPQDKALMMGLILARVGEAVKDRYRKAGGGTRHLTLIEEAHRLLANPESASGDSSRHAVETFADMLAEIRKYGEGLVIVDQIPGKLMPEVLKNTNTKIIHKLFARDDREAVGDSMGLDDDQKSWFSRLKTGEVIVFSGQWLKPVHAMVSRLEGIDEPEPEQLKDLFEELFVNQQDIYFPGLSAQTQERLRTRTEILAFSDISSSLVKFGREIGASHKGCRFCEAIHTRIQTSRTIHLHARLQVEFSVLTQCLAAELCAPLYSDNPSDNFIEYEQKFAQFLQAAFENSEISDIISDREIVAILRNVFCSNNK